MATRVINVEGTSGQTALDTCGCRSWILHWRRHSGSSRSSCMAIGCANPAEVGAHIRAHGARTPYIIGLCRSCNHHSNDSHFEVDERTWWVAPKYLPGCGIIDELEPGDIVRRSPTSVERLVLIEEIEWLDEDVVKWRVITSGGREQSVTLHGSKVRRTRM